MIAIDNIIPKILEDLNMQNITKEDLEQEVKQNGELLLTIYAMAQRWNKSRHDVNNLYKRDRTFPKPLEGVVKGLNNKQRVFYRNDVIEYEKRKGLVKINGQEN